MELDFALLADGVTPRPDGKLDIFGAGFDLIIAPGVPAQHPRLLLAVRVLLTRNEVENAHRLDVFVQQADGQELGRARQEISPVPEEKREQIPAGRHVGVGALLTFENLVFPEFGAYQIVIHWDGNEARDPIQVFVEETPPVPE